MNTDLRYNHHYITTDAYRCIIDGWSDGPYPDKEFSEAICINDHGGYQFKLIPDGEENPSLYSIDGIPLYKWNGEQVVPRTDAEIESDRNKLQSKQLPSTEQRLEALEAAMLSMMGGSSDV